MSKDILFSLWYDSLEGTKSQGFAYKAWCAGWEAAQKEVTLQEMSDIGQEIEPWDTSDMAHRSGGLTIYDDIQEYQKPWVGLTDKEIAQTVGSPIDEVYLVDFRRVIEKLRSKNT
jgi:hypothetical protein